MAWILLTPERLAAKTAELSAVKGIMLPAGQSAASIIAEELIATAKFMRGFCPGSSSLGEGNTIPDELEDAAYAIVRIKVFNRIEALKQFITESRTNEQKDALRVLREWKSGGYSVLPPTTENDTQLPGPSVTFKARKRRASTSELNGL